MNMTSSTLPGRIETGLFDQSPEPYPLGCFIADMKGHLNYINDELLQVVGADSRGETSFETIDDFETILQCRLPDSIDNVLGGRNYRLREHRFRDRQGQERIVSLHLSPLRNRADEVTGCLGVVLDITGSFRHRLGLAATISELSIILQISEALASTATLDAILKIILTGATANQGLGFNRAFLFLLDTDRKYLRGELAVGPAGPEEAGRIWSRLAQQEKTLKEMLHDYTVSEDNAGFSLSSLISDWRIPLDDGSFFARALVTGESLHVRRSDHPDPASLEILDRLRTDHLAAAPIISKGGQLGLLAADNQITDRPVDNSKVKLLQALANTAAVAVERSLLYDNLKEHAVELEKKNRLLAETQEQIVRFEKMSIIGELTASVAHELRNPLTVMGGFANLMLSGGCHEDTAEYLNIIVTEAKRAEKVLHQVLDFSRACRNDAREVDVNLLVSQAVALLQARCHHHLKNPVVNLSENRLMIRGNADQLLHAFFHFMYLAVDEVTDECTMTLETLAEKDMARMKIGFRGGDDARGRIVTTLKQIFGSPTGTNRLPVIVAGEAIKYHGGHFGVEGTRDNLPRIYVDLPLLKGNENA